MSQEFWLCLYILKITLLLVVGWSGQCFLGERHPRWLVGWWRAMAAACFAVIMFGFAAPVLNIDVGNRANLGFPTSMNRNPNISGSTSSNLYGAESIGNYFETSPQDLLHNDTNVLAMNATLQHRSVLATDSAEVHRYSSIPTTTEDEMGATAVNSPKIWLGKNAWGSIYLLAISVWGVGVVFGLVRWFVSAHYLSRYFETNLHPTSGMLEVADKVRKKLNLKRLPRIVLSTVPVPSVTGAFRPTVLLPFAMAKPNANRTDIYISLTHEMVHIAEKDLQWDCVFRLLSILVWPHPLVWKIVRMHRAACERVCDLVTCSLLENRQSYANCLARMAIALQVGRGQQLLLPLATKADILVRLANIRSGLEVTRLSAIQRTGLYLVPCIAIVLAMTSIRANVMAEPPMIRHVSRELSQAVESSASPKNRVATNSHQDSDEDVASVVSASTDQPNPLPNQVAKTTSVAVIDARASNAGRSVSQVKENRSESIVPSIYAAISKLGVPTEPEPHATLTSPQLSGVVQSSAGEPVDNAIIVVFDANILTAHALKTSKRTAGIDSKSAIRHVARTDARGRYSVPNLRVLADGSSDPQCRLAMLAVSPTDEFAEEFVSADHSQARVKQNLKLLSTTLGKITFVTPDRRRIPNAHVALNNITSIDKNGVSQQYLLMHLFFQPNLQTNTDGECILPKLPKDHIVQISIRQEQSTTVNTLVHTFEPSMLPDLAGRFKKKFALMRQQLSSQDADKLSTLDSISAQEKYEIQVLRRPLTMETQIEAIKSNQWEGRVVIEDGSAGTACQVRVEDLLANRMETIPIDEQGKFKVWLPQVTDPIPGIDSKSRFQLAVTAADRENFYGDPIRLSASELRKPRPLELRMSREVLLSGQVLTEDDRKPVAGVTVGLLKDVAVGELTSDDGRFTLRVPQGKIDLYAATDLPGIDLPPSTRFRWTDTGPAENRKPVKVRSINVLPNQPSEIEPILVQRPKPILIRVVDAMGQPVSGACLTMHRVATWTQNHNQLVPEQLASVAQPGLTDSSGVGRINPLAKIGSEFYISATKTIGGRAFHGRSLHSSVPLNAIEIRLHAAMKIVGKITHNGQPLPAQLVALDELSSRSFYSLREVVHHVGLRGQAQTDTNASGEFELIAPIGKQYQVVIPRDKYRKTHVDVITTTDYIGTAQMNFVSGSAKLCGTVLTWQGKPLNDARISLKVDRSFRHVSGFESRYFVTDEDGRFEIGQMPEGAYRISIRHHQHDSVQDQEFKLETNQPAQILRLSPKEPDKVVMANGG